MSDRNIFLQRQKLPFSVPSFFPVDIEESVIDQLRDDVQALRNCALTCRTWHLRSRYHLVQSIRVTTRTAYSDLCDFFKDNKTLGRSVKTLSVCPTEDEPKPVSLLAVALVPLPSHLPQLRTYKLRNLRADSLSSPLSFHATTLACLKHYLPNVQELILDSVSLSNEAELARLARSFPSLGAIRCENVRLRDRRAISSGVSAAYTDKLFLSTLSASHSSNQSLTCACPLWSP
ncbi:hypothetical protein C8Q74DRAFT_623677 [Fomes fomentarius]|nr:hypothetical protein C8Q74DRAFT_623677 [Fomes fomentarius]